MAAISGTTNSKTDAVIEQYKSYYKKMNIEQYGTSVLLQSLAESNSGSEPFGLNNDNSNLEELFSSQASKVTINKENIRSKIWADLEKEVQAFLNANKDMKGEIVVAINDATESGQPEFRISSVASVLDNLDEEYKSESADVISKYPVQLFQPDNLDINLLTKSSVPELENIVQNFLVRNRGVFQYLMA